ncbi:MAG: Rne/Rng family ribonuclease [Acidimicrobiales bacterium]
MAESQADDNKPKIGDSRPAPQVGDSRPGDNRAAGGDTRASGGSDGDGAPKKRRRRRGGRGRGRGGQGGGGQGGQNNSGQNSGGGQNGGGQRQGGQRGSGRNSGDGRGSRPTPVEAIIDDDAVELDEKTLESRRGRTRNGQAIGRYMMCVSVGDKATQISTLEGRKLVEHQVSRPADDVSQIHGNIYMGRVQNVLPGMEAAFVDIATPKNAVLYRGDVQYDPDDVEKGSRKPQARIEDILKAKQMILCQVTKNPIAHKGARLTQEVSLPGRFVVLVPNSTTYGISKRLPDGERKRLRAILDKAKPKHHGVIVRTAAEDVTSEEIERDVRRLVAQWDEIEALAKKTNGPALLYREPEAAVRIIREEFTKDFRGVIIDDRALYEEIRGYVGSITPALADRVEFYDTNAEKLPLFERQHIDEQLRKALDRKVWLPSGGSLIIEGTEALTVIDVNTGKNVGKSSLEETVFRNNLEAAEEVANQLRLRDIGGIIVIDFVDMEVAKNRAEVIKTFRAALARDKTRTQVFDISELGLVEMTRKRIGEGLLESVSDLCPTCDGRGHVVIDGMLG